MEVVVGARRCPLRVASLSFQRNKSLQEPQSRFVLINPAGFTGIQGTQWPVVASLACLGSVLASQLMLGVSFLQTAINPPSFLGGRGQPYGWKLGSAPCWCVQL